MSRTASSLKTQVDQRPHCGAFRCGVVCGDDVERAIEVRRRVYVEEFGFTLGGSVRDQVDDRATHLLAETGEGEAIASLRILDESERPFEIESFLSLSGFLTPGGHSAEITRLCIAAAHRKLSRENMVHVAILKAILEFSSRLGISEIIASTRKELIGFYRYLLFETFPEATYRHPDIGNSLHTLMRLNVTTLVERYKCVRPTLYRAILT